MTGGRTYWWAKDAAWIDRDYIVELGEEFGPAGPLVLDVLSGQAKLENDAGRITTGYRALARKCFLSGPDEAQRIVRHAALIGALDDLEEDADGRRLSARVSGWTADQTKGRAAQRKSEQRDDDSAPPEPERDETGQSVTERDMSREVAESHAPVGTGQDSTEVNDLVEQPLDAARSRLQEGAVSRVWSAYVWARQDFNPSSTGLKLTADRRSLIGRRLKEWPEDDLADAAKGWRHDPHNRGENERGRPFNDLELVLRDAAHIERFRDLHRSSPSQEASRAEWVAQMNAKDAA